jgi:flagellar biogenesis protein FliO
VDVFREIAAVVAVFGLLGLFVVFGKRAQWLGYAGRTPQRGNRRMQLLESLRVGPNTMIHLIRVDRRTMVVSVQPGGCVLLREAEEPYTRANEPNRNNPD